MEILKKSAFRGQNFYLLMGTGGQQSGALVVAFITVPVEAGPITLDAGPAGWQKKAETTNGASRTEMWTCPTDPSDANVQLGWDNVAYYSGAYVIVSGANSASVTFGGGTDPTTTLIAPSVVANVDDLVWVYYSGAFLNPWSNNVTLSTPEGMIWDDSDAPTTDADRVFLLAHHTATTDGETEPKTSMASQETIEWASATLAVSPVVAGTDPVPDEPPQPGATYQRRYFDAAQVVAGIDAATTFTEVDAAFQPIATAYGMYIVPAQNMENSGYNSEPYTPNDPAYKRAVRIIADELTKYPPAFVQSADLWRVHLVKNMKKDGDANSEYGGMTNGQVIYVDIMGMPGLTGTTHDDHHDGVKLSFQHEYQHTVYTAFATEYSALQAEWETHNPAGFVYGGEWRSTDGTRPTGFVRDYARASFAEDLADTWAHLMTTELVDSLNSWIASDPGVAGKVQILKDWFATKSATMTGEGYYDAIHAPSAGYDKTVPPWGQQLIRALGVGTWTKVSGPEVEFTADGTDLVLDPTPSFTAQQFVFDYGGDQTTITVEPATWGVRQGGVVVPVRLTGK